MDINDFAEEFISNLRTDASISGTDTADEFYQQAIDTLSENGEFDELSEEEINYRAVERVKCTLVIE